MCFLNTQAPEERIQLAGSQAMQFQVTRSCDSQAQQGCWACEAQAKEIMRENFQHFMEVQKMKNCTLVLSAQGSTGSYNCENLEHLCFKLIRTG